MFKLGFVILIGVSLACNFSESSPAAMPEKNKDVISEDEGPRKLPEKDDDGLAEDTVYNDAGRLRDAHKDENGEVDANDSEKRDEFKMEDEIAPRSRERRYVDRCPVKRKVNNPGWRTCCHIIWRRSSVFTECCGRIPYNSRTTMCCEGQIRYKPSGSPACCGTRAYSAQSHMCCGGTVQGRPKRSPACCGTQSYDSHECLCCDGRVWSKPSGRPRCCGSQAYNAQSQTCCGGFLYSGSRDCCGSRAYDDQQYICCRGVIRRKPARVSRCCRSYAYDSQKFICRGGNIKPIQPGDPVNPVK